MSATPGAQRASNRAVPPDQARGRRRAPILVAIALILAIVPTPTPTAAAGATGLYGPGIAADALSNTQVGGRFNQQVSYRFRATESSTLDSIGIYIIGNAEPGYAGGHGGTLRITVRPDDGSAAHHPTGTVLAARDVVGPTTGAHNVYSFPNPATLVAGRLYHIVFTNVDPSPTVNFVSLDGLYQFVRPARWQPAFPNTDWANLIRRSGEGWLEDPGYGAGLTTPIMQLNYGNGRAGGMGYMEVWVRAPKTISGDRKGRQVFTVSGSDRSVSSVSVRLKRVSGSGPLRIRLQRADGTVLGRARVPADAFPEAKLASMRGARWVTVAFPTTTTIRRGARYRLVLSAPSDTVYAAFVIRKGSSYRYKATTYFADGHAQYSSGGSWRGFEGWNGPSTEGDLQFVLRS